YPDRIEDCCREWTSAMPRDELRELEIAEKKRSLGIMSKEELHRRFADVRDSRKHTIELMADGMAELALNAEVAAAEQGIPPNLGAVMLNSLMINEDLKELSDKVAKLDHDYPSELAPV